MPTTKMIQQHLQFIDMQDPLLIGYTIKDYANNDSWKDILVLLNGNSIEKNISLPAGTWSLVVDGKIVNEKGIQQFTSTISVPATTAFVLFKMK